MAEWNVKRMLRPVPQPYKMWLARIIIPPFMLIEIPLVAITDSYKWCCEIAEEIASVWRDTREW